MNKIVRSIRNQGWVTMIREQKASGLTIRQWCAGNNLGENICYYRQRRIRGQIVRAAQAEVPDREFLQPLVKVPERVVSTDTQSAGIILRKGSLVISDPLL